MSEDERTSAGRPEGLPEQEASDSLARSLAARWGWAGEGLRASSQGRPQAAPEVTPGGAYARLALTGTHTGFFLRRIQSKTDRATVWWPDIGGLEPALVERFSEAILDRQPEIEAKYERRPLRAHVTEALELTLTGGAAATESGQEPALRDGFRPFGSLTEFRRALQTRTPPAGPPQPQARPAAAPAPPPRPAQRAAPAPLSVRRRALSPGERPLSRVEEVLDGRPGGEPPVTAPASEGEEGLATAAETRAAQPGDAGGQAGETAHAAPTFPPLKHGAVEPPSLGSGESPSQALQHALGPAQVDDAEVVRQDDMSPPALPARGRVTEGPPPAPPGLAMAAGPQLPPGGSVSSPSIPAAEGEPPQVELHPAQGPDTGRLGARMSGKAPGVAGSGVEPGPAAEVTPRAQVQGALPPAAVQRQAGSLQARDSLRPSPQVANEAGEKAPAGEVSSAEDVRPGPRRETTLPLAPLQRAPRRKEMPPVGMPPAEMAPAPEAGLSGGATAASPAPTPGEADADVEPVPGGRAAEAQPPSRGAAAAASLRGPEPQPAPRPAEPAMAQSEGPAPPPAVRVQPHPSAPAEAAATVDAGPAPVAGIGAAMEPPLSGETDGALSAVRLEETLVLPQLRRLARVAREEAEAGPGFGPLEPYTPPGPLAALALPPAAGGSGLKGEGAEPAGPGPMALAPTVAPGTIQRSPAPDQEPVGRLPLPSVGVGAQTADADLVQRSGAAPEEAGEGPDLNRLARDVLPLIRRMLAVERERRTGRWR